jgi:nucleoside-diphosphate-sugar epimerase
LKAVVTGAAGFIGSRIARRLAEDGHQVTGVDSLTDYYDPSIKLRNVEKLLEAGVDYVQRDLNDPEFALEQMVDGADAIFHQAGQPGVRSSWGREFDLYVARNVSAAQRLLEAVKNVGTVGRFVYASSSSIYGDSEAYPTCESTVARPISPYGVTKLAAEHLTSLYGNAYGLSTVSLRYFTVFGPGQRPDMAFTRFVRAAVLGEEITIFGTGEQVRDFTYVDDIVEANLRAASSERLVPGSVYNVAGGTNISVNGVLELLESLSGAPLNVVRVNAVPGDVKRTGGDVRAIAVDLGWTPRVTLEEGLAAQLRWAEDVFGSVRL